MELSNHLIFLNSLKIRNETQLAQQKFLFDVIDGIERKIKQVEELKHYYICELDTIIKEVNCLAKTMSFYFKREIMEIVAPIQCIDETLTLQNFGHFYMLLDTACTRLAYQVAIHKIELGKFSKNLFNLMSLYTHYFTSLSDLTRLDRETSVQMKVLEDRITNFFPTVL